MTKGKGYQQFYYLHYMGLPYFDCTAANMLYGWRVKYIKYSIIISWICYERSFIEFFLSIWNQLIFNQRLQLFVQSPQPDSFLFFFFAINQAPWCCRMSFSQWKYSFCLLARAWIWMVIQHCFTSMRCDLQVNLRSTPLCDCQATVCIFYQAILSCINKKYNTWVPSL